jgi:hypothetical protein
VGPGEAADSFRVEGAVAKPTAWTPDQLAKELAGEVKSIEYTTHKGEKETARAVPLLSVLQAAAPKIDPKIKNHQIAFIAVVRGRDGYTASFGFGELAADIGKREVWVALDRGGKPLTGDAAPVQLIIPSDGTQARWVRGIARIVVVDGIQAATAAAGTPEAGSGGAK